MAGISIVIVAHNGAEFVGAVVDCALAQTHPALEVICVDDGSSDATAAVLDSYRPHITVIRQAQQGLSISRNRVLAAARGEYVSFWDHDDLWHPRFLERCLDHLTSTDASVVGAVVNFVHVDRDGAERPGTRSALRGRLGLRDLVPLNRFPPGPVLLRRAAVDAVGGFDEALRTCVDWDLWLRLAVGGGTFTAVEDVLWRYRVHDRNMSRQRHLVLADDRILLDKLFVHPMVPPDLRAARTDIMAVVDYHASVDFFALGRSAEGERCWGAAMRARPQLLFEDESYWAVICAEQPPSDKSTPLNLDLARGEQRLLRALDAWREDGATDARLIREAYGRAYRALAALAYAQRDMPTARRCATAALRADPRLWHDRSTVGRLVKSFAGARLVGAASRWRDVLIG